MSILVFESGFTFCNRAKKSMLLNRNNVLILVINNTLPATIQTLLPIITYRDRRELEQSCFNFLSMKKTNNNKWLRWSKKIIGLFVITPNRYHQYQAH